MPLTPRLNVELNAQQTSAGDLFAATIPHALQSILNLTSGTGSGAADMVWSDTRTVNASSTDSLDLAGSLTGALGTTLSFARIKLVAVTAASGNTNNVVVTRPASNGVPLFSAAGDALPVRPGGVFVWACTDATGVAVTAGTGDLLDIVNSGAGTSVAYSIVVIGASA